METSLTGGHWRPCNIGSVEAHNERRPEYLESVKKAGLNLYFFEHLTKNNSHWVNDLDRYKDKTVADVFETMKKIYTEKTGQKPQLNEKIRVNKKTGKEYKIQGWAPIQEMCVPIKKDNMIEDFDYLKKWAKKYGIEIIRIDLHKDEGYHDEKTGEYKMNYHAHVVASFFDWETGRTVKPPSESMSEMQTILAIALGMGRGKRKEETGAKALTAMQYRIMKEREDLEKVEAEKTAAKEQLNKAKEQLKNIESEIKKCETKIKGLTTMIGNLEQQKEAIEIDITALKDEYAEKGEEFREEFEKKMAEDKTKLAEIEAKIEDKELFLKQANTEILELHKQREDSRKKIKTMVDDAIIAQDQRRQRLKELDDALKEKKAAIASTDKTGELRNADKAITARDNIIFRHWPDAKPAVNAIIERTTSPTATQFTPEQAMIVERAIASAGIDREAAAEELLALAQKEFDMQRTFSGWIQAVTAEVHGISTGGSASYINDLTGWDGKKKGMGL